MGQQPHQPRADARHHAAARLQPGGLVGHRQTTVSLGHDLGTPFNFRDTFSGIIRFRPEILRVPGMRATPPVIIDMQQASDGPVR